MRRSALSLAIIAALTSGAVSAGPYSDTYVFGDSLFDNGNFGVRFTNRVGPDYQTSEFGPVSPTLISESLKVPVSQPSVNGGNNYAVGGNRSLQTLESINAPTTYESPAGPSFNSLFYDLDRNGRTLDRNALYLLDGGGNDIGNFLVFDEESAGVVATNMVNAANVLKDRGAKYVVITNVPDFGLAPAGVQFASFATAQVDSINDQIRQQVGNSNILIFDAANMLREIAATPAAYGLNLSSDEFSRSCFDDDDANCAGGNSAAKIDGASPDPDQFFFNDTLHPTTLGQQVTADYTLSVLASAGEVSLLTEMGLDDMQAHWRAAHPVMRSNRWTNTTKTGSYTVWGGISGSESERDTDYNDTGETESLQYNLGLNFRFSDSWYLGAMVSRADNELEFDNSDSEYDMESLDLTIIGGYRHEQWFFEGAVSYSDLDYDDLKRSYALGTGNKRTEKADTSGDTVGVLANLGYNLADSSKNFRIGPMLGYQYVNVEVDGYREDGTQVTALVVEDQEVTTNIWSLGLFGELQLGFCACELYSEAVYQAYTGDSDSSPRIGMASVVGNSARLPGYERDDDGWRWDAGLAAQLSEAIELNVGGGIGDSDSTDSYWLGGEVSYSF